MVLVADGVYDMNWGVRKVYECDVECIRSGVTVTITDFSLGK